MAATAVSANFWMKPSKWAGLLRTVTNRLKKEVTMARGYFDTVDARITVKRENRQEYQQQNVSSMFMTYFDSS